MLEELQKRSLPVNKIVFAVRFLKAENKLEIFNLSFRNCNLKFSRVTQAEAAEILIQLRITLLKQIVERVPEIVTALPQSIPHSIGD